VQVVVAVLLAIVRFLLALPFWCAVLQMVQSGFPVRQVDYTVPPAVTAWNPLHHVVAVGDQTVIAAFVPRGAPDHGLYREVTSVAREPVHVRVPMTFRSTWWVERASDALFATDTDWWYATQAEQDGAPAVTFVKSDGARSTFVKPPELTSDLAQSKSWMMAPVAGEKPRVILFNYAREETIALEIDVTGKTRSWHLPRTMTMHVGNVIAEPLADGRIALIDSHDDLSLYLLGDDGHFDSIRLRNGEIDSFDGAMDAGGRIAMAGVRKATGAIEAAVIDPTHPDHAVWRELPRESHIAVNSMRIVATKDGFAAVWIEDAKGEPVEAAGIDRNGRWGPVVEVGHSFSRGAPFVDVQARNDELLFWWDDGVHLFERRLPASLTGYAATMALRCGDSLK
jgi:hypothetical protein